MGSNWVLSTIAGGKVALNLDPIAAITYLQIEASIGPVRQSTSRVSVPVATKCYTIMSSIPKEASPLNYATRATK